MAIPKYYEMYKSCLRALSDGKIHPYSDMKNQVIQDFGLSDDEISELLPSGRQTVFLNRIGWSRTYLKKSGLIESPSRAQFVITDAGRKILDTVDDINDNTLRQFPSFVEFIGGKTDISDDSVSLNTDETPQETMDRVSGELNKILRDEILTLILNNSPKFFESLVIELMERMGYGAGTTTQLSKDKGIDGFLYQDKLGLDVIYVQAKRYDPENKIGRPVVQQFSGAIPNNGKGVIITTSDFSPEAKQCAAEKHIILINGQKLAQLMIEHELGVSTEYVYKIKKIDTDRFEEE